MLKIRIFEHKRVLTQYPFKIGVVSSMFKIFFPFLKGVYSLSSSLLTLLPLSWLFFLGACSPSSDTFFQKMRPTSGVKLTELLDEVPVLENMFSNIDQDVFNDKLSDFLAYDPETSVFMLNQLYNLIRIDNHLPKLLDDASGILKLFMDYYQDESNQADMDALEAATDRFSELEFRNFLNVAESALLKVGSALHFVGNNAHFFPEDDTSGEPFASFTIWSDCSISDESFQEEKPPTLSDGRDIVYDVYELSRTIHCILDKALGDDFKDLFDENTGRVNKDLGLADIVSVVRSLDVEDAIEEFIDLMNHHRDKVIEIDQEMSDWLVSSPGKIDLIDYALEHLYPLLTSDDKAYIFKDGLALLDKGAPFLTTLNPDPSDTENKYLVEWLLTALNSDLKKMADLTSHTDLNLINPLYNKATDLLSSPLGTGAESVFDDVGQSGYPKNELRRFLDRERFIFAANDEGVTTTIFKGLFYDHSNDLNDGPLKVFANVEGGTNYGISPFRGAMSSRLSPVLGRIPLDYRNEAPLESFLNNFYYHVLDQYYSFSDRAWKVSRRKHGWQTLPVYMSRVQYSLFNLMSMNANAEHVTSSIDVSSIANSPARSNFLFNRRHELSEKVPYMTHFFHTLAGAMGYLDAERGPPMQTLETSLRAVGNDDVADDGIQHSDSEGVAKFIGIQGVSTAVICKPNCPSHTNGICRTKWNENARENHSVVCDNVLKDAITRNGHYYMPTSSMPVYELLTPGAFFSRNSRADALEETTRGGTQDTVYYKLGKTFYVRETNPLSPNRGQIYDLYDKIRNRYKGKFSVHQGDLVSTGGRTAEWAMSQFQFFGWQGYGPFTVHGKAPNGSRLKYANTFITDSYRAQVCKGHSGSSMWEWLCKYDLRKIYPLGNDGGTSRGGADGGLIAWPSSLSRSQEGAILMYESIYRPEKSGDPCWVDSGGPRYGHARYGYLRPSKDSTHQNNSLCGVWEKIQVDFDSREQAVAQNIRWLIYHKKFVLITPNYIFSNKKVGKNVNINLGFVKIKIGSSSHAGASFALFNIAVGNGLQGLVSAKLAGSGNCRDAALDSYRGQHRCNGVWNSDPNYNMMDSNDYIGKIPVHTGDYGNGFRSHTSHRLVRNRTLHNLTSFGRTSFEPGDSTLIVDYAVKKWGFGLPDYDGLVRQMFTSIPRPTTNFAKALAPLLSMGKAYEKSDVVVSGQESQTSFDKFRVFYERYFPNDEYGAYGDGFRKGPNEVLDVLEKLARSATYPGCLDAKGIRVPFCLTAEEMPYVPRVKGVKYPSTYDTYGNVVAWAKSDYSELKFSTFVSLMVQMMGTFHEAGRIYGIMDDQGRCALTSQFLDSQEHDVPHDYRDQNESCIRFFGNDGYREHINTFLKAMVSLNETPQIEDGAVEPEYNPESLINRLIETDPGKRDGVLIQFFRDFNVGNMPYFKDEIQNLLRQNLESILGKFELLSKDGGLSANLNKLRYFLTENVVREGAFTTNYLGGVDSAPELGVALDLSKEPLLMLKEDLLPYLRRLTNDEDLKTALLRGLDAFNDFLIETDKEPLNINSERVDDLMKYIQKTLHKKNSDGDFFLEDVIQRVYDSGFHDPDEIYNLNFLYLLEELPELADFIKEIFDYDVEAKVEEKLLSKIFGDYPCNKDHFYDLNDNGTLDENLLIFSDSAYEASKNGCALRSRKDYYDPAKYQLNMHYLSRSINQAVRDMDSSDIDSILDTLYSLPDITEKITEIKDKVITDFMSESFQEPGTDLDDSGAVDASREYFDLSGDGAYGSFTPDQAVAFLQDKMHEYLLEERSGKMLPSQTVKGVLTTVDTLLNPRNTECSSHEGTKATTCLYVPSSLLDLHSSLSENLKFHSKDLTAFRTLGRTFAYDNENFRPTYMLNTISGSLSPVMLAFRGKYHEMLDVVYYGLQPEGFLTFMGDSLTLPEDYKNMDLLADFDTLLNTKAMREYGSPGTFWWGFGDLIGGFADIVARNKDYSWETEEDYYKRIAEIFTETDDEFTLKD